MEILVIILIILVLAVGYQQFRTYKKPKPVKLTDEERKKIQKTREHFNNLMDYDYEKALKRE